MSFQLTQQCKLSYQASIIRRKMFSVGKFSASFPMFSCVPENVVEKIFQQMDTKPHNQLFIRKNKERDNLILYDKLPKA